MRGRLAWVKGFFFLLLASPARALDGEPVVVDVSASATGLGADELRRQIGEELHAPALAPGDPNAERARGTVSVDVDKATNELTVSYASRAAPIRRSVPLPEDPAAARREITVLAGNLARDEGGEVAAELRKKRHADEAKEPTAADREELERMHRVAAYYATIERRESILGDLGFIGGGAAAIGVGAYILADRGTKDGSAYALFTIGGVYAAVGTIAIFVSPKSSFEKLGARTLDESPESYAKDWASAAQKERGTRDFFGWYFMAMGAGSAAFGVVSLAQTSSDRATRETVAVGAFALGAWAIYAGASRLLTPGPIESSYRAFEEGSRRAPTNESAVTPRFGVAFVRGGAVAGLGGAF